MTDRFLIVNADDFNTDRERCAGILQAAQRGVVTSTTALANHPWDAPTVTALRASFGAGVGVHLNLTSGRPLAAGGRSLVDDAGEFLDKPRAWRRALARRYDLAEVEAEFAAQIGRLFELGIEPSHIDGNNHIHVFPGIAGVVARLAVRFDIRRIRLPLEAAWERPLQLGVKRRFISLLSHRAKNIFAEAGLVSPDHFAGIAFPRPGSAQSLISLLRALPAGVTELMCHPGYRSASSAGSFSSPDRERELEALTDPRVVQAVQNTELRLISFAELPSGS